MVKNLHSLKSVYIFEHMDKYTKQALKLFGESIKLGIEERGTNPHALSKMAGVSRSTIYAMMSGDKTYSIDSYIKVARILQIHIEFSLMSADNNIHTMGKNKPNLN